MASVERNGVLLADDYDCAKDGHYFKAGECVACERMADEIVEEQDERLAFLRGRVEALRTRLAAAEGLLAEVLKGDAVEPYDLIERIDTHLRGGGR